MVGAVCCVVLFLVVLIWCFSCSGLCLLCWSSRGFLCVVCDCCLLLRDCCSLILLCLLLYLAVNLSCVVGLRITVGCLFEFYYFDYIFVVLFGV